MERKVEFNVLDSIEVIYKLAQDSMLRPPLFEAANDDIQKLSSYCNLNPLETVLFAVAFVVSFDNSSFTSVFRYLGLDDCQILKYKKEIDVLLKRELIVKKRTLRSKNTDYEILQSMGFQKA